MVSSGIAKGYLLHCEVLPFRMSTITLCMVKSNLSFCLVIWNGMSVYTMRYQNTLNML